MGLNWLYYNNHYHRPLDIALMDNLMERLFDKKRIRLSFDKLPGKWKTNRKAYLMHMRWFKCQLPSEKYGKGRFMWDKRWRRNHQSRKNEG
jgi:hypothetical protein